MAFGSIRPLIRRSRNHAVWLGVAPFLIYVCLFLVYPSLALVAGAFHDDDGAFTLRFVDRLLTASALEAYWTSIRLSAVTALLGGLLGFLLARAAVAAGMPPWIRSMVTTLSAVAVNFAGVPLAFAFIATLGTTGILTTFLHDSFGVQPSDAGFSLYSFWGLVIVYLYFQIPLMVLVIAPALDGLRKEWHEAALSLGATSHQYWRYVALPVLLPSFLGAAVLLFGNAFGAYATAYALTSGQLPLVPVVIGQARLGNVLSDPHYADALAFGMVVVLTAVMPIYALLRRRASRWQQ